MNEKNKEQLREGAYQNKPADDGKKQSTSTVSMSLLAQVTTLAWNLVIPIVGGVLLGYTLDQRSENDVTWTLSLLVLGVLIAFSNLYNLYIEHGRDHLADKNGMNEKQEAHERE